ncbi:hypothetical protein [Henriciella sp.]|uniref:hypothetical protein n=1 Tax=Henriciella sp. TaxID=1968823 RepID=UPI0026230846|nr:hypothetical protein [Henriciella sp.]
MSGHDLGFFIAGLLVFFAFALAVQMRILAGIALKRAVRAKFTELDDGKARFAVANAVSGKRELEEGDAAGDAAQWLSAEYPRAIGHVRLARRATFAMGAVLLAVIACWRLTAGGEA